MAKAKDKLELLVTIHETAASIRLGGDGYFITFAGTEKDIDKAVMLAALKKQRLKLTVEIDDSESSGKEKSWP